MARARLHDVFLNIPFDHSYERLATSLIAGLVCLGRTPRCVLEIPDHGQGRLPRLLQMLKECGLSIHDLSRVGVPVRFNMPFELGLACALGQQSGKHRYMLLERIPHRLDRTLSDLKGRDAYIHCGSIRGILCCLLEALGSAFGGPSIEKILPVEGELWKYACARRKAHGKPTIFSRVVFGEIAYRAGVLAEQHRLIRR